MKDTGGKIKIGAERAASRDPYTKKCKILKYNKIRRKSKIVDTLAIFDQYLY
jgi:hypothetical protein